MRYPQVVHYILVLLLYEYHWLKGYTALMYCLGLHDILCLVKALKSPLGNKYTYSPFANLGVKQSLFFRMI